MLVDPPMVSVAVGITVGLLASFVQSAGLTLQRKSHIQNEALPEDQKKVDYKRPLWLTGFSIFILSNVLGSVFQLAALPVVILAPLGAVSLLWNAFFARLLLGDVFSQYMIIGTFLIAGGAVLIAIFGVVPEPTHSLEELLRLFQREEFIIYFSLLGAALGVALIITHVAEARLPAEAIYDSPASSRPATPEPTSEPRTSLNLSSPTGPASERTPLLISTDNKSTTSLHHDLKLQRTKTWIAISYASASGILSGMCLLFAKSGVELLILTITGKNQFSSWQSWVLVGGLVVFALLQLWYLHKSLILADPTLVCPLAFCFYNLSSIFNGLVYYDQFGLLSTLHLLLVLLGIVILLGGVWAVSVQPGGMRRVEVGTWQEGTEVLTAEVIGDESAVAAPTLLETPPSPGTLRSRRRTGIVSEGQPFLASPTEENEGISPLRSDFSNETAFPSLRSPTSGRSPTQGHRHSRYGGELGHGRPGTKRKWSTIFEPQPGTTAGLSIGLSATSPGFALVPRRRVSSTTHDELAANRLSGARSVSEGDINRRGSPVLERGRDVEANNAATGGDGTNGDAGQKKGWKWLKKVFKL